MTNSHITDRSTLEYNTDRDHLVLPEFGRHLQKMANKIKEIEDPEEQRAYVEETIDIIIQLFPQSKSVDNYREKLWHDMYYMAGFELGVLPPSGIKPTFEDQMLKPEKLVYPVHNLQFKHYGYNVFLMVQKALAMEEGPVRDEFAEVIGAYMKLAYKTWNKEHYVTDEVVREDFETMSRGLLTISTEKDLDVLVTSQTKKKFQNVSSQTQNWKQNRKRQSSNRSQKRK